MKKFVVPMLYPSKKQSLSISQKASFCSPSWARTKDPLINSQML